MNPQQGLAIGGIHVPAPIVTEQGDCAVRADIDHAAIGDHLGLVARHVIAEPSHVEALGAADGGEHGRLQIGIVAEYGDAVRGTGKPVVIAVVKTVVGLRRINLQMDIDRVGQIVGHPAEQLFGAQARGQRGAAEIAAAAADLIISAANRRLAKILGPHRAIGLELVEIERTAARIKNGAAGRSFGKTGVPIGHAGRSLGAAADIGDLVAAVFALVDIVNAVGKIVIESTLDMPPAAREAGARGHRRLPGGIIATAGNAALERSFNALEFLVENEIHHADDCIGAIGGRGAAGHDIDPLDQGLRQGVDVDGAVEAGGRHPHAVQQDQRTGETQIAQIEVVALVGAVGVPGGAGAVAGRAAKHRQLVERIGDVAGSPLHQPFGADGGDWRRRLESAADNARTRDRDLFHRIASSLRPGGRRQTK